MSTMKNKIKTIQNMYVGEFNYYAAMLPAAQRKNLTFAGWYKWRMTNALHAMLQAEGRGSEGNSLTRPALLVRIVRAVLAAA